MYLLVLFPFGNTTFTALERVLMANVKETSEFILDKVGGAENVENLTHCATRLRFQLRDQSKADQEALDNNPSVLGVVPQGSTGLQVVMGGDVAN